jgi:hypothetical protein
LLSRCSTTWAAPPASLNTFLIQVCFKGKFYVSKASGSLPIESKLKCVLSLWMLPEDIHSCPHDQ